MSDGIDIVQGSDAGVQAPAPLVCPVCHQPVMPEYYFCPNCGANLRPRPLPTDIASQIGLYAFSIILPMIVFIGISKWQGTKYFRSTDPKEHQIGLIAWILLAVSTIVIIYLMYVWTQSLIQSSISSINADMSL